MAKLSAKIIKPISIKITEEHVFLFCEKSKEYELEEKAKIKGEHYGFTLIQCVDNIEYEETYPTQGKINNIELKNGMLHVYESGKYYPWKFNNNGEMIENPTINSIYRVEIEYPTDSEKRTMNVYIKK